MAIRFFSTPPSMWKWSDGLPRPAARTLPSREATRALVEVWPPSTARMSSAGLGIEVGPFRAWWSESESGPLTPQPPSPRCGKGKGEDMAQPEAPLHRGGEGVGGEVLSDYQLPLQQLQPPPVLLRQGAVALVAAGN